MVTRGYGLVRGDALAVPLADESVDLIITSPPYFALRSYQDDGEHYDGQIGSEPSPMAFLAALWAVTDECWRVLKPTGSLWVDLGDKYAGSGGHNNADIGGEGRGPSRYNQSADVPVKSLMGLPWRFALGLTCPDDYRTLQADDHGDHPVWTLRAEVIWAKPSALPESVNDRVRRTHETWFHLTKQGRYYAAVDEVRTPLAAKTLTHRGGGRAHGNENNPDNNFGSDQPRVADARGALPGSVWTIEEDRWDRLWNGPMHFCPRCGRDLGVGLGRGESTPTATASSGSPTSASDAPIASSIRSSSDRSPTDSSSTTSAATELALTPPTSSQLPPALMSSGATPSRPATPQRLTASTATNSPSTTPTFVGPADESVGCVCETVSVSDGPGSVWSVPSEPLVVPDHLGVDHFAAFPQEWPRRIILGWSPPGICTACGEGRRPVVEKRLTNVWHDKPVQSTKFGATEAHRNGRLEPDDPMMSTYGSTEATITGYACACDVTLAPTRPSVILDPFVGTGTVVMVARALGRYGVGVDLSRDYLRLARWRISESRHGAKSEARTNRERQGVLW